MPRISVRAVVIEDGQILLSKYQDNQGFYFATPGEELKTAKLSRKRSTDFSRQVS